MRQEGGRARVRDGTGKDVATYSRLTVGDAAEFSALDPLDVVGLQRHDAEPGPVRRGRDALARHI